MKEILNIKEVWDILRNSRVDRVKSLWDDDDVFESVSVMECCDDLNEVYRDMEGWYFRGEWSLKEEFDKEGNELFERVVDFDDSLYYGE